MAEDTKIQWCDHTFNPWSGCTKVSPGCANCYAEVNYSVKVRGVKWGPQGNRIVASESMWKQPIKWDREAKALGVRKRVFCASLADVFEDWDGPMLNAINQVMLRDYGSESTGEWGANGKCDSRRKDWCDLTMQDVRDRLFRLIDATPNLDWLVLTKRPENIAAMMPEWQTDPTGLTHLNWPRPNLWLGTSCENQQTADERIPHLLKVPAAVRFLSLEPLLGPIDLTQLIFCQACGGSGRVGGGCNHETGEFDEGYECPSDCRRLPLIDWAIVGGESGHGSRPCDIAWIRSIVEQCKAANVPCFVKQLGAVIHAQNILDPLDQFPGAAVRTLRQGPTEDCAEIGLIDRKGGDMAEWPEDLRVRQFPA